MNPSNSLPGTPASDAPKDQVDSIRSMFGAPRLAVAPVLKGSSADEVIANPRIAIVDDEPVNVKVVQKHLELAGYQRFFTTTDARRAIDLIRTEQPDVVLLDMNLPVKDGWTTCLEAREDPTLAGLKIIALTAHAMGEDRDRAMEAGCDDFATKPVDFPDLLEKIEKLVDGG